MSLLKSVIRLKAFKPALSSVRHDAGGWNHIIVGPPINQVPQWKLYAYMGSFVAIMFSYPLYVMWMAHEWDMMELRESGELEEE